MVGTTIESAVGVPDGGHLHTAVPTGLQHCDLAEPATAVAVV